VKGYNIFTWHERAKTSISISQGRAAISERPINQAGGKARDAADQAWNIIYAVPTYTLISQLKNRQVIMKAHHTFPRTWTLFDQRGKQSLLELDEWAKVGGLVAGIYCFYAPVCVAKRTRRPVP
jgi:hypothetical protein